MAARRAAAIAARAVAGVLLIGLAVGAFVATRPEEAPLPTTTTTTTFPQAAYVDAMSASLRARVPVPLDERGARCIAEALLAVVGPEALHELTGDADPLAALTPVQRDEVLRTVVSCVDSTIAAALLGGGTPGTAAPLTLPTEDQ
jgi:hypothetical protein